MRLPYVSPLKEALGGQRINDDVQVEHNLLLERLVSFYGTGIKKLPIRWQKCIYVEGNHVEL